MRCKCSLKLIFYQHKTLFRRIKGKCGLCKLHQLNAFNKFESFGPVAGDLVMITAISCTPITLYEKKHHFVGG